MTKHNNPLLLASSSPRRKALLEAAGFQLAVYSPNVDETWPGGAPESGVIQIAQKKLAACPTDSSVCLAADTIVCIDGKILGKPQDEKDALQMLKMLSGRCHEVFTAFALRYQNQHIHGVVRSLVWFRLLQDDEMNRYISTGEPFDKAGSYGIQGQGAFLLDRIEGSYTNIMGLPLKEVLHSIEQLHKQ